MRLTNERIAEMCADLDCGVLDNVGIVGYTAARNYRVLHEAAEPFFAQRNQLIMKYGDPRYDDEGHINDYVVDPHSESFSEFVASYRELAAIETDLEIFTIPENKAIDAISGVQLLKLGWMFDPAEEE